MEKTQITEEDVYLSSEESKNSTDAASLSGEKKDSLGVEPRKKAGRVKESLSSRRRNMKLFEMSDGSKQAVIYSMPIHTYNETTDTYEENSRVVVEADEKKLFCKANGFYAEFNNESTNNELFSIKDGDYGVSVLAKTVPEGENESKNHRFSKKPELAAENEGKITYKNIHPDVDYEYSIAGDGVKENIVVNERSDSYQYSFALRCTNVTAVMDDTKKRVAFTSNSTGEEIFFIPAPFMTDAGGNVSTNVTYELGRFEDGELCLTVNADDSFINEENRSFPVVIDPQIKRSGASTITTYSWNADQLYSEAMHTVGTLGVGDGSCNAARMYASLNIPSLPGNPRIKKAELVLTQHSATSQCCEYPGFGLYRVTGEINVGDCTPANDTILIDYAKMKSGSAEDGEAVTYTFDVTGIVDSIVKESAGANNIVIKMLDETNICNNNIVLYGGSADTAKAPQLIITYESSYGVNTSYRTHTHELGRFGQGSVDLQCGNLMFESEDFSWSGNRMPVTVRHLYNSALAGYQYSNNASAMLNAADFSAMKIGNGFKLNLMQSIVDTSFTYEGKIYSGYVFIDENGNETYFKENGETACDEETCQCYKLYEDVDGGGMVYDPEKRTLTQGDDTYLFDESGRLIRISDKYNKMDITYTSGRITSVTDGAGRKFKLGYTSGGFLTSITAPDDTVISYGYTGNLLTNVAYPDGKKAVIAYSSDKPASVTLKDSGGNTVYKVVYTFTGNRLTSVTEYGAEGGIGASSAFSYSAASGRTVVTTTEQADEGESESNVIKTVYTFDDDGNVVSEYLYSEDTGKVGGDGASGGINPYSGGTSGVVSNINNLLCGHNFETITAWSEMPANCGEITITNPSNEANVKYGKKALCMKSSNTEAAERGVYQTTNVLPAGQYTFSVYLRVSSGFSGADSRGAYIRVSDVEGNILAESEHLYYNDGGYTRLIAPFELSAAQSVQAQILLDGKGAVYADAAQLENNPYANAYNMLENGNMELGNTGWSRSAGASYSGIESFNMSRSLVMYGDTEAVRHAYQKVDVRTGSATRETFTLSGWAKGYSLPIHDRDSVNAPKFRLRAVLRYKASNNSTYGETEEFTADFCPSTNEWQFASVQFSKSKYKTVDSITVYCDYYYNAGTVYFDDIQLVRDSVETGLNASDFTAETVDETYEEGADETVTDTAPTFSEVTDEYGNTITETTFTDGEFGTIYRSFGFDAEGNDLIRETDARGNDTAYTVNAATSRNEEVTDRLGNKTAYEYDDSGRTTKVTSKDTNGTALADVSYSYDAFDNMTLIHRGDGMKYVLAYNQFHNLESIGIEDKDEALIKYTYKNGNGRLKEMTYANGDTMKATYNSIGQMIAERWYNLSGTLTAHYKYTYDGQGNVVRSIDILAKKEYNYEYEEGRIVRATECDIEISGEIVTSKVVVNTVNYFYDSEGRLKTKIITPRGGSARVIYYENNDNGTVVKFTAGSNSVTSHSKTDSFGRKVFDELQIGTGFISRQFSYHAGDITKEHSENANLKSTATTQLVSQIVLSDGRTLSYEYDAEERITKVTDSIDGTTAYSYDALGQLLTEKVTKAGVTSTVNTMTYDNYGNIVSKNGVAYTYGDTVWKDKLTKVGTQSITYDKQGNPLTYLGHNLTWEKGRQLKSYDSNTYTYNANGIRTSKTVNGVTHTYTLEGTKILREVWGNNTLVPLYDNEESVCGILYNGVPYYFLKNLQGDVISIIDDAGESVARYSYDAWGVPTIVVDTTECKISEINPYRYRSYYYDTEIAKYYLQSRYYDANVGRFINCDEITTILLAQDVGINLNLFAYCKNSPVIFTDDLGLFSFDDIKKFFNEIISGLKKRIEDYFKSLLVIRKRYVSISTDVFSTAINIILGLFLRSYVVKSFNTGLAIFKYTYLASHTGKAVEIMTKIVNFFLNNEFGKFLVKMMARQVVISAGLSVSLIGVVADGLWADFINSVSKLASKVWTVVSAFSSIGNLLSFVFCDLPDGTIDGRLTIAW